MVAKDLVLLFVLVHPSGHRLRTFKDRVNKLGLGFVILILGILIVYDRVYPFRCLSFWFGLLKS